MNLALPSLPPAFWREGKVPSDWPRPVMGGYQQTFPVTAASIGFWNPADSGVVALVTACTMRYNNAAIIYGARLNSTVWATLTPVATNTAGYADSRTENVETVTARPTACRFAQADQADAGNVYPFFFFDQLEAGTGIQPQGRVDVPIWQFLEPNSGLWFGSSAAMSNVFGVNLFWWEVLAYTDAHAASPFAPGQGAGRWMTNTFGERVWVPEGFAIAL